MTNNTTKKATITKKDNYSAILAILKATEDSGTPLDIEGITYESLTNFVNNEIQLLNNKAASAKKRSEEKKIEGDALRELVYNTLTEDWMSLNDIVSTINDPDVSKNMVISRLSQLGNLGKVEKDIRTIPPTNEGGKSHKSSFYRKTI